MAKAIRSYPKQDQKNVINRRLQNATGGLGYLSAVEAEKSSLRNELVEKGLIKPLDNQG